MDDARRGPLTADARRAARHESIGRAYGWLLIATIAWGALAFGAVYPWAYWPLTAASATLGVWGLVATHGWQDPRVRSLALALGGVLLAIGVQIVALPYWLVATLSPGLDRFFRAFEIAYHPAALHALSLAPDRTAVDLVFAAACALLLVGLVRAIRAVRLDWLVSQIMGLGVGLAVIGVVQQIFTRQNHPLVYGFWRPLSNASPFGPFINHNHFAGWMVMAVPLVTTFSCAIVDASAARVTDERGGWTAWATTVEGNRFVLVTAAAIIMGTSIVLTGSRSGMTSFAVGLLVLAYFIFRRVRRSRLRFAAMTYLALVLVAALVWAGSGRAFARFDRAPMEAGGRLAAWRDTARIIQDFPWFGVGVGSYPSAMLVYQTANRSTMFAQAHNDYLQLAAEGGVLVGVPVIIALALFIRGVHRRLSAGDVDELSYWLRRGAVAGLLAIATQSLVEFSLQMPGNLVLFVVLAALAIHRPKGLSRAHRV